jgi:hypothetical protein
MGLQPGAVGPFLGDVTTLLGTMAGLIPCGDDDQAALTVCAPDDAPVAGQILLRHDRERSEQRR